MEDSLNLWNTILELINDGQSVWIEPHGVSMLPLIKEDRDSVLLTKIDKIKKYDIILYKRENGQYVLHRVMKINKDNTYSFAGDNQSYLETGIKYNQLLAKAISKKENKQKEVSLYKNKLYIFFWCVIFINRRVIFKLKRIFKKK